MLRVALRKPESRPPLAWRALLRLDALGLALATCAWFGATAWMRALRLPDEGRYVGVAFEMLRSGDWLTPTLDGLPFFHKPPLFYWITAGAMSAFGANAWAARAAPLAGAALALLALHAFLQRWAGLGAARAAALALAVQPLWFLGAQFANMDMLVAGCIAASVLAAAHAALCFERGLPWRGALRAACVMAALGVLAKGLIGVVLPALVVGTWLAGERRWRTLRALADARGAALLVALAAPWFAAMQIAHPGFLDFFIVVQHLERYAAGGFNNVEPAWFYPALLLLCALPLAPWLRAAGRPRETTLRRLALAWIAVVVLFFSIPKSKPIGYVLPALPPLALLAGLGARRASRGWWASVVGSAALGLAALLFFARDDAHSTRDIALALAQRHRTGEPVYMLERYDYDVAFYARLAEPVRVVSDWSSVPRHDGWRRELLDAARFADDAARAVLVDRAALPAALCAAPLSWLIGPADDPALAGRAERVFERRGVGLWRIEPGPACRDAL